MLRADAKTSQHECERCRYGISLPAPYGRLPRCPMCGGRRWRPERRPVTAQS
jgi:hypothetical protein